MDRNGRNGRKLLEMTGYRYKWLEWLNILKLELTPCSHVSPTEKLVFLNNILFGENRPRKIAEQSTHMNKTVFTKWNF